MTAPTSSRRRSGARRRLLECFRAAREQFFLFRREIRLEGFPHSAASQHRGQRQCHAEPLAVAADREATCFKGIPPIRTPDQTKTSEVPCSAFLSRSRNDGSLPCARRCPEVDPTFGGVPVDVFQLFGRKLELIECADVLLQLCHAAGPDERRRDAWIAQSPGERHLRQRLAAPDGDLIEGPYLARSCSVSRSSENEPGWLAREAAGTPARYRSMSRPCASGENTMQPIPSSPRTLRRSGSIHRFSIE